MAAFRLQCCMRSNELFWFIFIGIVYRWNNNEWKNRFHMSHHWFGKLLIWINLDLVAKTKCFYDISNVLSHIGIIHYVLNIIYRSTIRDKKYIANICYNFCNPLKNKVYLIEKWADNANSYFLEPPILTILFVSTWILFIELIFCVDGIMSVSWSFNGNYRCQGVQINCGLVLSIFCLTLPLNWNKEIEQCKYRIIFYVTSEVANTFLTFESYRYFHLVCRITLGC